MEGGCKVVRQETEAGAKPAAELGRKEGGAPLGAAFCSLANLPEVPGTASLYNLPTILARITTTSPVSILPLE